MAWQEAREKQPKALVVAVLLALVLGTSLIVFTESVSVLICVAALVACASWWLMYKAARIFDLTAFTIPAFFYWLFFSIQFLPSFFIFSEQIDPYRYRYIFSVQSVLITFPLGILLMNHLMRFKGQETRLYYDKPVEEEAAGSQALIIFLFLLLIVFALTLFRVSEGGTVPLFYLMEHPGEHLKLALLREDADKLLDSPLRYAYSLLRSTFYPFLILLAFGRYLQTKRGNWLALFGMTFIAGLVYVGMTIEKSPVAAIVGLLVIYYYLYRHGRPPKIVVGIAPLLFMAFPFWVVIRQYYGTEQGTLQGALETIGDRLFHVPANVLYYYFEVFPDVLPYQHGAGIGKLAQLMGWRSVDIPNFIGLYMTGSGPRFLSSISANAAFVGNLHADFGLYGVVIGGILAGMLMQGAQIYIVRRRKTVVNVALYAFVMYGFGQLSYAQLQTTLLSGGVSIAFVLAWVVTKLEGLSKRFTSHPVVYFEVRRPQVPGRPALPTISREAPHTLPSSRL